MTHVVETMRWKDDFQWREFQLSVSCTSYPKHIPLVLIIYSGGLEQDTFKVPDRIFSGSTEITLGRIRTVVEAHILSSLYHCGTPAGIINLSTEIKCNSLIYFVRDICFCSLLFFLAMYFLVSRGSLIFSLVTIIWIIYHDLKISMKAISTHNIRWSDDVSSLNLNYPTLVNIVSMLY